VDEAEQRVDRLMARYCVVVQRMAMHGPDALSDDDFRVVAAVAAAMHAAAIGELARRAAGGHGHPPTRDARH
jgi:hypothetical protein